MKKLLLLIGFLGLILLIGFKVFFNNSQPINLNTDEPSFTDDGYVVKELINNLDRPWGISFLPSGEILFTQRTNQIFLYSNQGLIELNPPDDTYVRGEGGLTGVTVDPEFNLNSYVYLCFNSKVDDTNPSIKVSRFNLDFADMKLINRKDIVSNIPSNLSGRHSGCQIEFGPNNYLWIGTGDTAQYDVSQNPMSLGGKILRVDRDGNPVDGNIGGAFDARIYSYGHRNTQGLGFFKNEGYKDLVGVSIEHGPDKDDEVNLLLLGNFGWDPLPNYGEGVPMTDIEKFPQAIDAIWSSDYPTIAASGGTIINSEKWGKWQNSVAVAALKGSHIRILQLDTSGKVIGEEEILKNEFGRFRTIKESLDGNLYLLTDNGKGEDQIIVLEPSGY